MSKSILVIDTPESCMFCLMFNMGYCKALNYKKVTDYDIQKVHPLCPLQDTKELLEALEEVSTFGAYMDRNKWVNAKSIEEYNKLYKALGGE